MLTINRYKNKWKQGPCLRRRIGGGEREEQGGGGFHKETRVGNVVRAQKARRRPVHSRDGFFRISTPPLEVGFFNAGLSLG